MKSWVTAILAILLSSVIFAVPTQAGSTGEPAVTIQFFDMSDHPLSQVGGVFKLDLNQQFQAQVMFRNPEYWNQATVAFRYGTSASQFGADTDGHFVVDNTYVDMDTFDAYGNNISRYSFAKESEGEWAFGALAELGASNSFDPDVTYGGLTYIVTNKMLAGTSGNISIYQNPVPHMYPETTIDSYTVPGITYTLTTIPEPSSLMAMGCAGVGVLGNLLHRRRKKTAAKS